MVLCIHWRQNKFKNERVYHIICCDLFRGFLTRKAMPQQNATDKKANTKHICTKCTQTAKKMLCQGTALRTKHTILHSAACIKKVRLKTYKIFSCLQADLKGKKKNDFEYFFHVFHGKRKSCVPTSHKPPNMRQSRRRHFLHKSRDISHTRMHTWNMLFVCLFHVQLA